MLFFKIVFVFVWFPTIWFSIIAISVTYVYSISHNIRAFEKWSHFAIWSLLRASCVRVKRCQFESGPFFPSINSTRTSIYIFRTKLILRRYKQFNFSSFLKTIFRYHNFLTIKVLSKILKINFSHIFEMFKVLKSKFKLCPRIELYIRLRLSEG